MQNNGGISLIDWSGIPSTWNLGKLGDYCEIRRGASPRPAGDPKYFGGDIPWFKIGDATKNPGRFLTETAETVNEEGARRSVQIPAGSLIIANSGVSLGFAVFVGVTGCVHDGWLVLNNFNGIDDRYIFYCVNLLTSALRGMADGTTQPNLNTTIARNLVIPVPPIDEQRRIAETLWSLDDKIELNRRMNATLEATARALFKAWFLDFEPVHANKENRPSTSAPPEIAKFFPSDFENGIPKGWTIGKVGDVCSVNKSTLNKSDRLEFLKYVEISEVSKGVVNRVSIYERGAEPSRAKRKLSHGDIVISTVRPDRGSYFLAFNPETNLIASTGFAVFTPRLVPFSFLYLFLTDEEQLTFYGKRADGAAYPAINQSVISGMELIVPDEKVLAEFHTLTEPRFSKMANNLAESESLAEIRDSLLPKLISGRVKVY